MTSVRLPLFPLNSVLFPGLVLPLNVFEARYRAMMRDLSAMPEDDRRFAVITIRDGREVAPTAQGMPDATLPAADGPAAGFGDDPMQAFHTVGCVADAATIREKSSADDTAYEVLATGTTRFRLLSVDASGPYLTAELEELADDEGRARARWPPASSGPFAPTRSGWPGRTSGPCRAGRTCRPIRPCCRTWWPRRPYWTSPPSSSCWRRPTRRPG